MALDVCFIISKILDRGILLRRSSKNIVIKT